MIKGPTIGMVGEYPGAASNPEVISPLSKLQSMINNNEQTKLLKEQNSLLRRFVAVQNTSKGQIIKDILGNETVIY